MRKFSAYCNIFLFILYSGCSTSNLSSDVQNSKLVFNRFLELKLGSLNQEEALNIFGQPDKKVSLESSTLEGWLYFEKPWHQTKLSLIFDNSTKLLRRKVWMVSEHESENNLDTARARFPHAHFESRLAKQSNPHFIPDNIIFTDKRLGLTIVYKNSMKEVESISWSDINLDSIAKSVKN